MNKLVIIIIVILIAIIMVIFAQKPNYNSQYNFSPKSYHGEQTYNRYKKQKWVHVDPVQQKAIDAEIQRKLRFKHGISD